MKKNILPILITFLCLTSISCNTAKETLSDEANNKPLNVLLITLDDMGYGTSGVEGSAVPDITPNIDKLASQGIMFSHGYVMTPICGPSRAAILSGRYPHCSGMMGHGKQPPDLWEEPDVKTPSISTYLHDYGYATGAILKHRRSAYLNTWDTEYFELPMGVGNHDRNPESFYKRTKAFIESAKNSDKPFFLYANPIDPHRPWDNTEDEQELFDEYNPKNRYPKPSRTYTEDEIEIPNFLVDLPEIRKAMVPYYNALHRGDECIGAVLKALEESGAADNTLVIFLSDHGLGAAGAKSTLYQDGIRTPIIMKWPNHIKEGIIDDQSIVSSIDIVPTIIDAVGLPPLSAIEGKSVYKVITNEQNKTDRAYAYAAFNYENKSTEERYFPQRAIINGSYLYIWNSHVERSGGSKQKDIRWWHDVVNSSLEKSEKLKKKIESLRNRPNEEFFDLSKDPGCWNNLINNNVYIEQISKFRKELKNEMLGTNDPERFYYLH
jgi:N-sulfoglucosamine sulfohydrolase